jgi:hypothetical protein
MNEKTASRRRCSRRELSRRSNGGIDVRLFWDAVTGQITVRVSDRHEGTSFELSPRPEVALDAFHHPYTYLEPAGAAA